MATMHESSGAAYLREQAAFARELKHNAEVLAAAAKPFPSRLPLDVSAAARQLGLTRRERRELLSLLQAGKVGQLTGKFERVWWRSQEIRDENETAR